MSDFTHREEMELRLKAELDDAERSLLEAPANELPGARLRYRHAVKRFSRLVMDGVLPQDLSDE